MLNSTRSLTRVKCSGSLCFFSCCQQGSRSGETTPTFWRRSSRSRSTSTLPVWRRTRTPAAALCQRTPTSGRGRVRKTDRGLRTTILPPPPALTRARVRCRRTGPSSWRRLDVLDCRTTSWSSFVNVIGRIKIVNDSMWYRNYNELLVWSCIGVISGAYLTTTTLLVRKI